jgi:hypothetical protein
MNKTLQESADVKKRVDLLNEEITLLEEKRKTISSLINEEKAEKEELYKTLSKNGFKFDNAGELTNSDSLWSAKAKSANLTKDEKQRESNMTTFKQLEEDVKRYNALIHSEILNSQKDFEDLGNQINSVSKDIKSAYQDELEIVKTVESKIHDMMKQSVEDQKTELDNQLSDYEKYINDKIDLLDDLTAKEEYEKNLNKQQQTIQEIQNKINEVSLDDSLEGKSKLADLQKQLTEEQDNLTSMQSDREKELRRDNLEDALATEQERVQAQKDALDQMWSDEQINTKARQALMDGYYTDAQGKVVSLTEAYVTFENKVGEGLTSLGEQIKSDFLTQLEQAREIMKDIVGLSQTSVSGGQVNIPSVPSFDVGTNFVPYDMIAKVHYGEQIIPAKFNPYNNANNLPLSRAGIGGIEIHNEFNVEGGISQESLPGLEVILKKSADYTLNKFQSMYDKWGSSRL